MEGATSRVQPPIQKPSKPTTAPKKRAKRACFHCKKAKSSCTNERPCLRCVRLGFEDTCLDTPRADIRDDEKKLWEHTLTYLSTRASQPPADPEEEQFRLLVKQYASRVSNAGAENPAPAQQRLTLPTGPGEMLFPSPLLPQAVQQPSSHIQFLAQQNESLSHQVANLLQQLEHKHELTQSYYTFSVLSTIGDVAYSRWTFPAHTLLDYNRGFLELTQRAPEELRIHQFSCKQLYHERYLMSCALVIYLLCHGLVTHIESNQNWSVAGREVPVKTFLNVNFDSNGDAQEVVLFSKRSAFSFPKETLFKPLDLALSQKAKDEGFDLREYFRGYNYMPDFLRRPDDPPNGSFLEQGKVAPMVAPSPASDTPSPAGSLEELLLSSSSPDFDLYDVPYGLPGAEEALFPPSPSYLSSLADVGGPAGTDYGSVDVDLFGGQPMETTTAFSDLLCSDSDQYLYQPLSPASGVRHC